MFVKRGRDRFGPDFDGGKDDHNRETASDEVHGLGRRSGSSQ